MAAPSSPTRSRWGPLSTEFQFHDVGDPQLVKPSWCFVVKTMYLHDVRQVNNTTHLRQGYYSKLNFACFLSGFFIVLTHLKQHNTRCGLVKCVLSCSVYANVCILTVMLCLYISSIIPNTHIYSISHNRYSFLWNMNKTWWLGLHT